MSDTVMDHETIEQTQETQNPTNSLLLKRTVVIKSQVTDAFRAKANGDLGEEIETLDNQLNQLQSQYQETLRQLEDAARQGHNVAQQMDLLHKDVRNKQLQLQNVRAEVAQQLKNLDKVNNGDYVITGQLENMVSINVGDNLYDKIRNAELLLKDGVVTAILG